jgi:GPH family glycoside/pentoside/hexuronide:cation symporter
VTSPALRVPLRIAAFWGLGTFGTTTLLNGVAAVLLYYLVNFIKIEPVVAGGMLFTAKLLDMFVSPPMGLLSDRTRSPWGRRRPYLLGASFFCGAAFALLFNVPLAATGAATYGWIAFTLLAFVVSYTVFQVPYMAMPAEMTQDYHERTRIMTFRVIFMTFGNMMGVAGCPGLVKAFGNDRLAYGKMGIAVGAVVCVAMLLAALGTRGAPETRGDERRDPLLAQMRSLLDNRPLLVMMGLKVTLYAGVAAFTAVMLFFFASVLKKGPEMLAIFGVVNALTTVAFTPVQVWLARRIDKKNAYCACLVAYAIVMSTWLFCGPEEPIWIFALRAAGLGVINAGLFLHSNSMLIDAFAYDHRLTGLRREGVLAATFTFVEKLALAFGPLVIGALLSSMGFDKNLAPTADQSPSAVTAMYIGFLWIPIASQLGALLLMRWYTLKREDLEPAALEGARA